LLLAAEEGTNPWVIGILLVVALVVLIVFAVLFQFVGLWVRALVSGARVTFLELIGMRLRKFNTTLIVNARIQAVGAGLNIPLSEMQTHYQAGGDLMRVINAMIAANKANIDLPWKTATAIDLAGRDVLEAVQTRVN